MSASPPVLAQDSLAAALAELGEPSLEVRVLEETGSTNGDLVQAVHSGDVTGPCVIAARHQTRARGRLERSWAAPPDSSLLLSVFLSPEHLHADGDPKALRSPDASSARRTSAFETATDALGLLPLAVGAAAVETVRRETGVRAELKWPNDVLVGGRKLAGILCQLTPHRGGLGIVAGIGLNAAQSRDELPVDRATSLALEGAEPVDPNRLAAQLVAAILRRSRTVLVDRDLASIASLMSTVGARVRVERVAEDPAQDVVGTATGLAPDGGLIVVREDGVAETVHAGDVWHLRDAEAPRTRPSGSQPVREADRQEAGA